MRTLVIFIFIITKCALSFDLPPSVLDYLTDHNRKDLISASKNVLSISPEIFLKKMQLKNTSLLGAGYFGVVFHSDHKSVFKLSHIVFSKFGLTSLNKKRTSFNLLNSANWNSLEEIDNTFILKSAKSLYDHYKNIQVGGASILDELYGELIWSAFTNSSLKNFPIAVTTDGLALERRYIKGITFDKILESNRNNSDLAKNYSIDHLLKQLVEIQRLAEQLLLETGLTIDILTPKNFLVIGNGPNAILFPFDKGLIEPSKEAKTWYSEHGFYVPDSIFKKDIQPATVWPLIPEHILYSKIWNLTLDQAKTYVKHLMNLTTDHKTLKFISELKPLPFTEAPEISDFSLINECNRYFISK